MATAQNLPQGNAEENSCRDPCRVLSKRLEALNFMGKLVKNTLMNEEKLSLGSN